MKQTGEEPPNLIAQDIGFTMETMSDALKYVNDETNIYPLWLCPITCLKDTICNSQGKSTHSGMHVDFGVYGCVIEINISDIRCKKSFQSPLYFSFQEINAPILYFSVFQILMDSSVKRVLRKSKSSALRTEAMSRYMERPN